MMKKLMTLLLAGLLPLCALAELGEDGDVTVTLPGAEFFFTPMEDSVLLTRESSASVFNRIGLSQREVVPYMEEYDVYAMLFDLALETEIQISASPTTDQDYDDMDEYGEMLTCESVRSFYEDQGYQVDSVEIYRAEDGHKYVKSIYAYTYEDGYVEYTLEYFTCQAGYAVFILLFPYEGAPTEAQILQGDTLADSLWMTAMN